MARLELSPQLMIGDPWADYALIDSGNGRKLERFGRFRFIRPEPQAMWSPRLENWQADGEFVPGADEDGGGRWDLSPEVPDSWNLTWDDVQFHAQCTPFRHLGFFPDMASVWEWMRTCLSPSEGGDHASAAARGTLNLFGYTGVGTLALSQRGPVTHVDASKKSVAQARENASLAGMEDRPIRWLVDDAAKFAAREVRRENRYDGIILDPPKFGRGPKNETWRIEESLAPLIADCRRLLDENSRFLFLTVYAVRMSSLSLAALLDEAFADGPGTIEHGDLGVREDSANPRILPTAIFARWRNSA